MTRPRNVKAAEIEEGIQAAINVLKSGTCKSAREASRRFNVPHSTLTHRLSGHVQKNLSHKCDQNLTHAEEKELVRWITKLTQTGYPPRHRIVHEMAEEIRHECVCQLNTNRIEYVSYLPLGKQWAWQFIHRHTELETVLLRTIEAARIKDTNHDALSS